MLKLVFFLIGIGILGMIMPQVLALEANDRVLVSSQRLVNAFGEQVFEHVNINQQVQVAADIANGQDKEQLFVYILQIKNDEGHIVSVSTIAGELQPVQSFNAALSWRPTIAGNYVAEIFVWESLVNADALTKPITLEIIVS